MRVVTSVTIARPCSLGRPSSARFRRLLIGLGSGLLVGLAAVGATARSAAATPTAVPPGTPNLALIALAPADVPGGRVLHQGYFTDADLVAGYDREFKAGASIGHSRALSLENELDVLEDAADAHASVRGRSRRIFGSPGGRALLTKSILDRVQEGREGQGVDEGDVRQDPVARGRQRDVRAARHGHAAEADPVLVRDQRHARGQIALVR